MNSTLLVRMPDSRAASRVVAHRKEMATEGGNAVQHVPDDGDRLQQEERAAVMARPERVDRRAEPLPTGRDLGDVLRADGLGGRIPEIEREFSVWISVVTLLGRIANLVMARRWKTALRANARRSIGAHIFVRRRYVEATRVCTFKLGILGTDDYGIGALAWLADAGNGAKSPARARSYSSKNASASARLKALLQ